MDIRAKKDVGMRIKTIRLSKGMTQEEFGKYFNASKGNVATWEKGSSLPNAERLKMIAKFGDLTVDHLLHGDFFTYFTNKIDDVIPKEKKYLAANIPMSTIRIAWDKIVKEKIMLGEEDKILSIINDVIKDTDTYFTNTTLRYYEYLKNNIEELKSMSNRFSKENYFTQRFESVDDFVKFLRNATLEEIGECSGIIESIYGEIDFTKNNSFQLLETETFIITFEELKSSKYTASSMEKSFDNAVYKYAQHNISNFDYALAVYDHVFDRIYVVAQFNDGYKKLQYGKAHFAVYDEQIFISELDSSDQFELLGIKIPISKIEYYRPLLSVIY